MIVRTAGVAVAALTIATAAPARDPNAPAEPASRFTFGPLGVTPSMSFTNVGIDTNVFNEPVHPNRDFTATVTPKVDARLRARSVRLTGSLSVDSVYFHKYVSQRSTNIRTSGQVDALGSRTRPFATVQWVDVKERLPVGRTRLSYRTPAGVDDGGFDRLNRLSGGIGFRFGDARLSVYAEKVKRTANLPFDAPYTGNRYYTALSVGL